MTLAPGAWLGLSSSPDAMYHVAFARELTTMLAFAAGWLEMRGRRRTALALALLGVAVASGFWSLALRRPYGLLVDPTITRWAADVMVTESGGTDRLLAGEPGTWTPWRALAAHVGPDRVLAVPSLLPPLVLVTAALAIALLWPRRPASLAAVLWAAGSTGALDSLRGIGFLDLLWRRPSRAIAWTTGTLVVLALSRVLVRRWRALTAAVLVVITAVCVGGTTIRLPIGETAMLLTFDQHVWLAAGIVGLVVARDPLAVTLVGGAATLVVLSSAGWVDAWAAAAYYRLGLVLAATQAIEEVVAPLARGGSIALGRRAIPTDRLVPAAAVTLLLAGAYVTWWDPPRLDALARESLAPVAEPLVDAMDWIRQHTDPRASFIANEDYAPAVAALAGRRVLRAPSLLIAADDERRRRLEQAVFAGRWPEPLRRRYDLRYVFLAPGQFTEYALEAPEDLEARGHFRLLYRNDKGMRLYELERTSVE